MTLKAPGGLVLNPLAEWVTLEKFILEPGLVQWSDGFSGDAAFDDLEEPAGRSVLSKSAKVSFSVSNSMNTTTHSVKTPKFSLQIITVFGYVCSFSSKGLLEKVKAVKNIYTIGRVRV